VIAGVGYVKSKEQRALSYPFSAIESFASFSQPICLASVFSRIEERVCVDFHAKSGPQGIMPFYSKPNKANPV